jgi:hypothetical protein
MISLVGQRWMVKKSSPTYYQIDGGWYNPGQAFTVSHGVEVCQYFQEGRKDGNIIPVPVETADVVEKTESAEAKAVVETASAPEPVVSAAKEPEVHEKPKTKFKVKS